MSSLPLEATPAAAQFVGFQDEPQQPVTPQSDPDATRYGWSPGQDLNVSDRLVGHQLIPRCALVPFKTITLKGEDPNRQETAESQYDVGMPRRRLAWVKKSAMLCLEEVRLAYSADTPAGFTGFDAPWVAEVKERGKVVRTVPGFGLVGYTQEEAFELYKLVLPFVLKPKEILLYLSTESEERIVGAKLPPDVEAAARSVRASMIDGVRQCVGEYSKVLESSIRERAERPGTGKGKPVFDRFDRHVAEMLDEALDAKPAVMAPAPADPNVAAALQLIGENMAKQNGESEELRLLREQNELLRAQLAQKGS